jgi:hypothetical protein
MTKIAVNTGVLKWAIERVGDRSQFLYQKFPRLELWKRGDAVTVHVLLVNGANAYGPPLSHATRNAPSVFEYLSQTISLTSRWFCKKARKSVDLRENVASTFWGLYFISMLDLT